jgi:glyoxylate reductase
MADQKSVFITTNIGEAAIGRLRELNYEVEVYPEIDAPPKALNIEKIHGGNAPLITSMRDKLDEEYLAAADGRLQVVAQMAVGIDNIDREAANRHRVPFTNTPDVLTEATAEFALFMMGAVARKLYPSEKLVEEHNWRYWHPSLPFLGDEVTGKTVAVIGAGRIGKAFAKKCIGLEMDVLLYNANSRDERFVDFADREMQLRFDAGFARRRHRIAYLSFEEALAEADFVSLHLPLIMPEVSATPTYHLIDRAALALMKPSAYLINTSRGPVVEEGALFEALLNRQFAGAALDVFEK